MSHSKLLDSASAALARAACTARAADAADVHAWLVSALCSALEGTSPPLQRGAAVSAGRAAFTGGLGDEAAATAAVTSLRRALQRSQSAAVRCACLDAIANCGKRLRPEWLRRHARGVLHMAAHLVTEAGARVRTAHGRSERVPVLNPQPRWAGAATAGGAVRPAPAAETEPGPRPSAARDPAAAEETRAACECIEVWLRVVEDGGDGLDDAADFLRAASAATQVSLRVLSRQSRSTRVRMSALYCARALERYGWADEGGEDVASLAPDDQEPGAAGSGGGAGSDDSGSERVPPAVPHRTATEAWPEGGAARSGSGHRSAGEGVMDGAVLGGAAARSDRGADSPAGRAGESSEHGGLPTAAESEAAAAAGRALERPALSASALADGCSCIRWATAEGAAEVGSHRGLPWSVRLACETAAGRDVWLLGWDERTAWLGVVAGALRWCAVHARDGDGAAAADAAAAVAHITDVVGSVPPPKGRRGPLSARASRSAGPSRGTAPPLAPSVLARLRDALAEVCALPAESVRAAAEDAAAEASTGKHALGRSEGARAAILALAARAAMCLHALPAR